MKLSEYVTFKNGKKKPAENGEYPIYGGNGILGFTNQYNSCSNSIIIGRVGAYCGCVYKEDDKCWISDNAIVGYVKEGTDYNFMYYYLKAYNLNRLHIGSGHPLMTQDILNNIDVIIPNYDYQVKAGLMLKKLDDKIKLNTEINNNLYEMLKRLYKELYLNNPSYNAWESMTLNDVTCKFATGLNPRKNFVLGQGNNYYVTIKNMPNNQVILDDKCDKVDDEALIKINKRSDLKVGDLLFSGIGTIGRTYLIKSKPTNWNISESVFTIRPNDRISSEFLYLLLLDSDMQNYAVSKASGSVQKGIRMADLKLYKLKVPGKEWMDTFTNTISPLIDKIYLNYEMNEKLCRLRDTLLPKLMNGEIDLDSIEI